MQGNKEGSGNLVAGYCVWNMKTISIDQEVYTPGFYLPRLTVRQGGRLSRKDAAAYLGVKPGTLKAWARTGYGPRAIRVGSRIFYEVVGLRAFSNGGRA